MTTDTQSAQAVARAVVSRGLLDEQTTKQAFYSYWEARQQGRTQAGFDAWLVAQGLLNESSLQGLGDSRTASGRIVADSNPTPNMWGSAVIRGGSAAAPPPPAAAASSAPEGVTQAQVHEASPGRTLAFDDVLPGPPSKQGTFEIDLDVGPPLETEPPARLQSTAREMPAANVAQPLDIVLDAKEAQEAAFFSEADSAEEVQVPEGEDAQVKLPELGEVLGDYKIVGELGRGAMGIIYKAEHVTRKEIVALKILVGLDKPGADKRRRRFQREVDALRRLHHENIVGVHTCGRKGQLDWYVMDHVQGRELKELMREPGALTPRDRLMIFEKICEAVAHAHERGVVHRDLKPANVLIDDEKGVHVLDFGLAKIAIDDDEEKEAMELTKSNATIGTPYYMSPEQFTDAKGVDWRADIYALGVLLYEMMCDRRPFEGETAGELIQKVLTEEAPLASSLNPKLSPKFDQIIIKAIDRNRDRRYQQAEELRLAVGTYRRGAHATSDAEVALERLKRWIADNKKPFLAGMAAASLIWLPIVALAYLL